MIEICWSAKAKICNFFVYKMKKNEFQHEKYMWKSEHSLDLFFGNMTHTSKTKMILSYTHLLFTHCGDIYSYKKRLNANTYLNVK